MKLRINADRWYETHQVNDGVTLIYEPWIKESHRCNIWHVRGRDRDLLVDSGLGVVSLCEQVPLVAERQCLAVSSHTHYEGIGNLHEFEERLVHCAEAGLLTNPTPKETLADPLLSDDIFTALPPEPWSSSDYSITPAPATRLLEGGDVIDLGDRTFTVIHTPGHSPGGIALFEGRTGILFSGGIVYDGPLVEDARHSNINDYLASMLKLIELPVSVVHGGHYASYGADRHREIIRNWLNAKIH